MAAFLVSYDLYQPGQDYDRLEQRLTSLGPCTRVLFSAWVVSTKLDAREIIEHLSGDASDSFFVVEIQGEWAPKNLHEDHDSGFLVAALGKPI
jgi:hypothetical protein